MPALATLVPSPSKEVDEFGMTPIAIARQPHHLPGLAVDGKRDRTVETTARIESNHMSGLGRGSDLAAEQLLRRRLGIVGIGEWGQRVVL